MSKSPKKWKRVKIDATPIFFEIAMRTLKQIAETPRGGRCARNAKATLHFIENHSNGLWKEGV